MNKLQTEQCCMTRMVYLFNAILVMNFENCMGGFVLWDQFKLTIQFYVCRDGNKLCKARFFLFFLSSFPFCTIARLCICIISSVRFYLFLLRTFHTPPCSVRLFPSILFDYMRCVRNEHFFHPLYSL